VGFKKGINIVTSIAVVGIGCRLPGGIGSPEALWVALMAGTDLVTEIPQSRWNADLDYDAEAGVPGRSISRWGAFLDDPSGFDYPFFGFGEPEALAMDPQHRLLLEVTWEAVEHAGRDPKSLFDTDAGVFFGLSHQDYMQVTRDAGVLSHAYSFTGTPFSMASGRVAHALGLKGPALTLDTACSSSLVAIHAARRSLLANECSVAFAGGAMLMFAPTTYASASGLGMLSPTGRCRSFDAQADGFVRAEGCGVVMLKRLGDALRDNDRVLAVIRGSAVNQNGGSNTILAPSRAAQVAVIEQALADAQVDPAHIGMIEAHGTGTQLGDTEEYSSLSTHYGRQQNCALGSLKSNLGHTESAAGVLGLIKATLALGHGVVPRTLHFTQLPAHLQAIQTQLFVPTETVPWPVTGPDGLRRAAVSSFGMSGTNAHFVLEQAPLAAPVPRAQQRLDLPTPPRLFPISATSHKALCATAGELAAWLKSNPDTDPLDVAQTLACRRGHRPVRHGVIARTLNEVAEQLHLLAATATPEAETVADLNVPVPDGAGPVFVFSGQGSQWDTMGATLLDNDPVFAAVVARLEPLMQSVAGFSVTQTLRHAGILSGIDRIQPALFAMQVALAASLKANGVVPSAVIGHSMGEAAAAVVAGALSLEDGVLVICHRAILCRRLAGRGAMAVVELAPAALRAALARHGIDDIEIAVLAAPLSTVVGGSVLAVQRLVEVAQAEGFFAREVAVDVASHTSQVEPILDELAVCLSGIAAQTAHTPIYSTTLLDPRESVKCDRAYWVDNLRHTVRFRPAVQAALEDGHRLFVEIAPHPIVTRAVIQNADAMELTVQALPAMTRGAPMAQGMLDLVGALYTSGAAIDFGKLYPDLACPPLDLPLPVWTHVPLFLAPTKTAVGGGHSQSSAHPFLTAYRHLHEEPERHVWVSEVGLDAQPWLADHKVKGVPLFPGAGFCEMALTAARTAHGAAYGAVRDMTFAQALWLDAERPLVCTAVQDQPGILRFRLEGEASGAPQIHASALLVTADVAQPPAAYDLNVLRALHDMACPALDVWAWFAAQGIEFGPSFRALGKSLALAADGASLLAELRLPSALRQAARRYAVHPVLLDACFQSVGAFAQVRLATEGRMLLPLSARSLVSFGNGAEVAHCLTRLVSVNALQAEADIDLLDASGQILMRVQGLIMGSGGTVQAGDAAAANCDACLLDVAWEQWSLPPPKMTPTDGTWLLLDSDAAGHDVVTQLATYLGAQGFSTHRLSSPLGGFDDAGYARLQSIVQKDRPARVVAVLPRSGKDGSGDAARLQIAGLMQLAKAMTKAEPWPRLYVVSCMAQAVLPDDKVQLEQAGVRGWLRALGAELPTLHPTQIDVDLHADLSLLVQQMLADVAEDETALRGAQPFTARLHRSPLGHADRHRIDCDGARDGMRLAIRNPGDLQTLELIASPRTPPAAGEIEVAVHATSVNFADVLVALGRYPTRDGQTQHLGLDFAGVVTAIGPGVLTVQVGNRVAGMCGGGAWGAYVTCDARLVVPVAATVSDIAAAAMLTTTATAWYGLHDLARIGPGDKVLIHSATGGVGQAAVAIARAAGAQIFATAGSQAKRAGLRANGIKHVYDSRSTDFAAQIRQDTSGYGVDIVLNSLTGGAQRAGLELLAPGGRFVEIGKKDIYGDSWLGLSPFKRNLSFFALDLALMCTSAQNRLQALLAHVMELAATGVLAPPDIATYPLAKAVDAMRIMSGGGHTGKLVLSVPRSGHLRLALSPQDVTPFNPKGAYIVTGGLGGLGLFLADMMSAAGCGRLVLNARSAPSDAAKAALAVMRARGTEVDVIAGDISDPTTARRLVDAAHATGLKLRGVLHAAAVVEDGILTSLSDAQFQRNWAPKVEGALHLHHATLQEPLDWFCCFSSVAALFGSAGQSAYAAANSWLDGFTTWRRAQGLASSAVAWAAWAEIGAGAHLAARGDARMIAPSEGAYAFEALLRHDRAYAAYAHLDGAPWLAALAARSPFAAGLSHGAAVPRDSAQFLQTELHRATPDAGPALLRRLILAHLGVILRRTVSPDRPLFDYGLDSLGTLQLLLALEADTGIRLGALDVTNVRALADKLSATLRATLPTGAEISG
jgi:polyketide synthase 5